MSGKLGCFGKLKFKEVDKLQRCLGAPENYWADAVPLDNEKSGVCSIDTITLDPLRISASVTMGIFHALNDIYAAKSRPTTISASLTVPSNFEIDALLALGRTIKDCAKLANCMIGKLHTNRSDGSPTLTVCVIGSTPTPSEVLAPMGSIWILDELSDPQAAINGCCLSALAARLTLREVASAKTRIQMKDVSGDGLAGALHQLSLRHRLSIRLNLTVLLSLVERTTLDACSRDRNYGDYADIIENFEFHNSSVIRHVLFEPQLFGPLVCLTECEDGFPGVVGAIKIGTFTTGQTKLRIEAR